MRKNVSIKPLWLAPIISAVCALASLHARGANYDGGGEFEAEKRLAYTGDAIALALRIRDGFDPNTRFTKPFFAVRKGGRAVLTNSGANLLHLATLGGSERTVAFLLRLEVDPDLPDEKGLTPLHYAVRSNSVAVCQRLLAAGAHPDRLTKKGESPLHLAFQFSHLEAAKVLVEKLVEPGFRWEKPGPENRKGILSLALSKHEFWPLVSPHLDRLPIQNSEFKAALGTFAARGELDKARQVLARLDTDAIDELNVLYHLAELGQPDLLRIALARGADPDARNQAGETALHIATYHATRTGWTESRMIGTSPDPANHLALLDPELAGNRAGSPAPVPKETPPPSMDTPFAECMAALLKHGADIDARDHHGHTPLHIAVLVEQPEETLRLTGRNANTSLLHLIGGATEWFNHSVFRAPHVAEWLLEQGAAPSIQDKAGRTPLNWAKTEATRKIIGATLTPTRQDRRNRHP